MLNTIQTASEEYLINLCERIGEEDGLLGGLEEGNWVVQLSDEIAAKFGYGVTAGEAATQQFAYEHVDSSIVRVPRVYRFFQKKSNSSMMREGYLFMEYVPGQILEDLDLTQHSGIVTRVAQTIAHLGQISGGQVPGPLAGDEPQGYLWGDYGAQTSFQSINDLNAWLNRRLLLRKLSIDLTPYPLVLCHMDLYRRNMILDSNGSICLVDWGHAALLPRFFEFAAITCLNPYDEPYEKPLFQTVEQMMGITDEEKRLIDLLHMARGLSLRYRL
jgi:aminoglycoside phosphotransferase (APT) family kinase protein